MKRLSIEYLEEKDTYFVDLYKVYQCILDGLLAWNPRDWCFYFCRGQELYKIGMLIPVSFNLAKLELRNNMRKDYKKEILKKLREWGIING